MQPNSTNFPMFVMFTVKQEHRWAGSNSQLFWIRNRGGEEEGWGSKRGYSKVSEQVCDIWWVLLEQYPSMVGIWTF